MNRLKEFITELESSIIIELPKPFLLLAGISGTGKSRFVREQAKLTAQGRNNFCMVAVRPDWHEPSDLLGYTSRLSGTASYVATDVLRFVVAAWKAIAKAGLQLSGAMNRTVLQGDAAQLDNIPPFWLCLDEMNLAPVEQYFADYLARIETREWDYDQTAFTYRCDALLNPGVLHELDQSGQAQLSRALGLNEVAPGAADHALWQHFVEHGIAIPPNLIVAGTVNMDETTHGFSRKVIDRALSFDFGEFFPNDFNDYYPGTTSHVALSFPRHSRGSTTVSADEAAVSIEFLNEVNKVLRGSPFELAFRALNELLLAVGCHGMPQPGAELQAVWDDFLMQKVLPRIEGDADKLKQDNNGSLLTQLEAVLQIQLAAIWDEESARKDFYRTQNNLPAQIPCRTRAKLQWMQDRLESSGFTSFWP